MLRFSWVGSTSGNEDGPGPSLKEGRMGVEEDSRAKTELRALMGFFILQIA